MKFKYLKLFTLLLLTFGLSRLHAQNAKLSGGGSATGTGGSVTFSIGQIVTSTISETNGSLAQGVQQPFEISIIEGIEEAEGIQLEVSAYPNPVNNDLTLKIESVKLANPIYQLFDINGNLLTQLKIEGDESSINMSQLLHATYILRINEANKEIKTFRIIKN
ncbi:MAG: T9SS type A sorting domain-containing protein [Bacteroidales bacterium]|jgi:hypothetical protein